MQRKKILITKKFQWNNRKIKWRRKENYKIVNILINKWWNKIENEKWIFKKIEILW
jgi:hypothetical protein